MRIYGTSPLYNYVELVFRCKKLFILAIIVGSVITSSMVYMRKTTYTATFIAILAGDVDLAGQMQREREGEITPAMRKANRLMFWVLKDPEFMPSVLKNAGVDRNYAPDRFDDIVKKARTSLSKPTIVNSVYMEVAMTWPKSKELEEILSQLYSAFARKTVDTETAAVTARRVLLDAEYKKYNDEADQKAKARVIYLTDHYWQQAALLGASMSQLDRAQNSISDLLMDLNDTKSRLAQVDSNLSTMSEYTVETEGTIIQTDPTVALATRLQEMQSEKDALLQRYNPGHPAVKALQANMDNLQRQIDTLSNKPQKKPSGTSTVERKKLNPTYAELKKQSGNYAVMVKGLERRVSDLRKVIAVQTDRVKHMPADEVAYEKINREYTMANSVRNQAESQLMAAKIDEERDLFVQSKAISLMVKPKADSLESGGKTILLYALGPILGIIVAFGFSLLLESLDHTLRTPIEVERYLGKPVLAVIPKMHAPGDTRKKLAGATKQSITS